MLGFQLTTAVTFGPLPTGQGTWIRGWLIVLTGLAFWAGGLAAWRLEPWGWLLGHSWRSSASSRRSSPCLGTGNLSYALAILRLPVHPALVPEPAPRSRRPSASPRNSLAASPKGSLMTDRSLDELGPVDSRHRRIPGRPAELHRRGRGRAAAAPRRRHHPGHGPADPTQERGRVGRCPGAVGPRRARGDSAGSRPTSPRPWPRRTSITWPPRWVPGSVAGVLVYENLWAAPLASAIRRAGGQLSPMAGFRPGHHRRHRGRRRALEPEGV